MNRPNRQLRRRRQDRCHRRPSGAGCFERAGHRCPKAGTDQQYGCTIKARTQAINQLHALVVAPDQVKHQLRGLSPKARVKVCAGFRPGDGDTTIAYAKHVLRLLARRYQTLTAEIGELDTRIKDLCARANPALLATTGIGPTPPPPYWSQPVTTPNA